MLPHALHGMAEVVGEEQTIGVGMTLNREAGESFSDVVPSGVRSSRGLVYSCIHSLSIQSTFHYGRFQPRRSRDNTIMNFHWPTSAFPTLDQSCFIYNPHPPTQHPPIHTIRHCFKVNSRYHIISSINVSACSACVCDYF